jgi:ribosomal-protein-alanine N-acetyltransferase
MNLPSREAGAAGFQVREAAAGDVAAVVELERGVEMAPHWEPAVYEAMLGGDAGAALQRWLVVAGNLEGELVGFAVGRVLRAGEAMEAELESVAVRGDARRRGMGRALCEAVMAWANAQGAEAMELEVRASSAGAIGMYQRLGFVEWGRRGGYYRHPAEDAVRMRVRLGKQGG